MSKWIAGIIAPMGQLDKRMIRYSSYIQWGLYVTERSGNSVRATKWLHETLARFYVQPRGLKQVKFQKIDIINFCAGVTCRGGYLWALLCNALQRWWVGRFFNFWRYVIYARLSHGGGIYQSSVAAHRRCRKRNKMCSKIVPQRCQQCGSET